MQSKPSQTQSPGEVLYGIPLRFRRIENLHILLWLLKDAFWALNWRLGGLVMILPTLTVAVLITWQTRHLKSEWLHNLAVDFWILANCTWMVGEFFGWDEDLVYGIGLRQVALIPFSVGLCILAWYYLGHFWKDPGLGKQGGEQG